MRRAFSMMMAIAVMVIMMGVSAMVFSLSNKIIFATTAQYQKEQAILLAKSYTEYTLMAVTANVGTIGGATCMEGVDGNVTGTIIGATPQGDVASGMGYSVRTEVSYIGNDPTGNLLNCTRVLNTTALSPNSNGQFPSPNIIVDVYVRYRDVNFHRDGNSPWMTYHRRTIQKI